MRAPRRLAFALCLGIAAAVSCGDDPPPDDDTGSGLSNQTGEVCAVADDCFSDVPLRDDIPGDFMCLDRVEGGYCTHECTTDADCCSVEEECPEGVTHVCAPFESTGMMMCFISCEDEDIDGLDPEEHCDEYNRDFICRSTGGGSANRKVCVPGGGDPCSDENDCGGDLLYCCEDSFGDQRCYDTIGADGRDCINEPPL